jgi:hypothetical protein
MLIGLLFGTLWVYIDVTKEDTDYNLKQLLGITAISAAFGPILIGLFVMDRYQEQLKKFSNKSIIGGKK